MEIGGGSKNTILRRRVGVTLGAAFLILGLSACTQKSTGAADIISQKPVEDGRTQITVLVKHAFEIDGFEKMVEEKFSNIDIVQVGNYTRDMGIEGYKARLEHDDLTDIVITWPLAVGEEYWEDRLMDLSGMDYTSNYNISMLNDIARDGKLYYLPGPAQIRGIVYNKTMFEENGWEVPKDFDGFVKLCHTIEDSGTRSLQLGLNNSEVLDTAFVGYGYASCFNKPGDKKWLENYNNGQGKFIEQFDPALDTFQRLVDEGILKKEDLDIDYSDREKMFFTRQCAMIEDSVLMCNMGVGLTGSTDEMGLMPFFNPDSGGDWARLYMVCYIGVNKHLAEPANKAKFELVNELMEYISSPDGQEALMVDNGSMFSSATGTALPDIPAIEDLIPALSHGRYGIFPELKNAQAALREGLAGMVNGELSKEEVAAMVDKANLASQQSEEIEVLGTAKEDFTMIDTGNFVTDVMKQSMGSDLALFLDDGKDGRHNAKGISASLYQGDVTSIDINCIMPDLKYGETGIICKVSMTGEDLLKTLEYSINVENNNSGWFYYFSGLKMEFNPAAEPGSRIKKITLADGSKLDPQKEYTIAVMENTVPEESVKSIEKSDKTIFELLTQAIQEQGEIAPAKDKRFVVVK